jgi:hypothetical protein
MSDEPTPRRALAIALLASLLLWNLPFGGYAMYPFKLLATWMHELSHGIVMLLTGAGFDRMDIYRDGSGLAFANYGVGPFASAVIAAAGYMGTPVWGAAMLLGARGPRSTRGVVAGLGAVLVVTALLVVSNRFGQTALAITGGAMIAIAAAPYRITFFVAQLVGAQACVNAVLDIRVLFRPALVVDGQIVRASDAHAMARATVGTDDSWGVWLWAGIWLAWSLALFFFTLRRLSARDLRASGASASAAPASPSGLLRDRARGTPRGGSD